MLSTPPASSLQRYCNTSELLFYQHISSSSTPYTSFSRFSCSWTILPVFYVFHVGRRWVSWSYPEKSKLPNKNILRRYRFRTARLWQKFCDPSFQIRITWNLANDSFFWRSSFRARHLLRGANLGFSNRYEPRTFWFKPCLHTPTYSSENETNRTTNPPHSTSIPSFELRYERLLQFQRRCLPNFVRFGILDVHHIRTDLHMHIIRIPKLVAALLATVFILFLTTLLSSS